MLRSISVEQPAAMRTLAATVQLHFNCRGSTISKTYLLKTPVTVDFLSGCYYSVHSHIPGTGGALFLRCFGAR